MTSLQWLPLECGSTKIEILEGRLRQDGHRNHAENVAQIYKEKLKEMMDNG
uniref:Uncharacterized protein n=1 Tax=Octopus bimaculoides TaxID=37653 RepID=A0A0L8HAM5_OCTBM